MKKQNSMFYRKLNIVIFSCLALIACKEKEEKPESITQNSTREASSDIMVEKPSNIETPEGMVWIPGGTFMQGAMDSDQMAMNHEKPAHEVAIDGFFMDKPKLPMPGFKSLSMKQLMYLWLKGKLTGMK
jgi:formylglycine-generating enzyme required for sulfatase activity